MSVTMALTLDDEVVAYLEHLAAVQGRTAAEVAAWIVTEDVHQERAIDAELVARLDAQLADDPQVLGRSHASSDAVTERQRAGA